MDHTFRDSIIIKYLLMDIMQFLHKHISDNILSTSVDKDTLLDLLL
jgi:hypothetical protein